MTRKGLCAPSVRPRRPGRRAGTFTLEMLEARSLLSTATVGGLMSPAAVEVSPDFGGPRGGGGTSVITNPTPYSSAVTPAELARAYGLNTAAAAGAGTTVAIVTAYHDPNVQADLAKFSTYYNLATASLTVVNQYGQSANLPATSADWSLETAMDVEWAHAAAPGARIVLVEANSASTADLMAAVKTAAGMASVVSMSWGGSEFAGQTAYDTAAYFANPNVTFVAASGDDGGASGASWPASSPYVLSVGGTTLSLNTAGGYGGETAWTASGSRWSGYSGSGGGVSTVESLPSYQASALGAGYAKGRVTPDVSLDANPNSGLSVYDSVSGLGQTGWFQVGGTSAGTPVWAGLVAAADSARAANHLAPLGTTQTLNLVYGLSASSSAYAAAFHDVTSGSNFAGRAGVGYDKVTGLGSPVASALIASASTYRSGSAAVVKTLVATPTAVATTPTPTPVAPQAVASASAASTGAVDAVASPVFLGVTAAVPAARSSASASAAAAANPRTASAPLARPVQPVSTPSLNPAVTSSDDEPVAGAAPDVAPYADPDPSAPAAPDDAPKDAPLPAPPGPIWDEALEGVLVERGPAPAPDGSAPAAPADRPAAPRPAASAALAGLAVTTWGLWEHRTRRAERDRRRTWLPRVSPAV